jgi:hypothetical protein
MPERKLLIPGFPFIINCASKCVPFDEIPPERFITGEFLILYNLWRSLVTEKLFTFIHEVNHLACNPY